MDRTYEEIREALSYYIDRADNLSLPEEYSLAEELADKIWHLEETLLILKELSDDTEGQNTD